MDVKLVALALLFVATPALAQDDKPASATGGSADLNYARPAPPVPPLPATRAEAPPSVRPSPQATLDRIINRPHTIAELEAGIIALPNAPISPGQRGGDVALVGKFGRGDATINTGIHVLYRFSRSWVIGAGGSFAPSPTSDSQYGGLSSLPRTHSRSYLFLGGEVRWVPIHYKYVEAWVGGSTGATIVADRFVTDTGAAVPSILGTKEVTVRTEGFAIGAQLGVTYYLTESFLLGANLRGYEWLLPDTRRCTSIGDCATLSGTVSSFQIGITLGYRLPL